MSRSTFTFTLGLLLALGAAACGDDPEPLVAPEAAAETMDEFDATISDDGGSDDVDLETFQAENPMANIYDPRTGASFPPGQAQVVGSHQFTGNVSTIDVTANLAFLDKPLAEVQAHAMKSEGLVYGLEKSTLLGVARIYTDKECGLELNGSSKHMAKWETLTPGTITWGEVRLGTQAEPARKPDCEKEITDGDGAGISSPDGMICYYLITYDLETGEIYDAELITCDSGGGELY